MTPCVLPARFIDIEGIDQSGKKTQTGLLVKSLRRQGFKTATLDFPVYSTALGREIRAFLDGRKNYPPAAVHMLYSLNRWENRDKILKGLNTADFLLSDRYTASNLAYGLAKRLDLKWLATLDRGLPQPDLTFVLDVPVKSSFSRKREVRDLHESDRNLLRRVRGNYLKLARRFGWHVIDGTKHAIMVHEEIWNVVKDTATTSPIRKDLDKVRSGFGGK